MSLDLSPDNFKGRPYGYLTNQISHIYLGFSLTSLYIFILKYIAEYPNQVVAGLVVGLIYFVWWEMLNQGWRGWDTVEDTGYVLLGCSPYFIIDFGVVMERVVFFLVITWVLLLIGVSKRLK